jgi:hypothetical protein
MLISGPIHQLLQRDTPHTEVNYLHSISITITTTQYLYIRIICINITPQKL